MVLVNFGFCLMPLAVSAQTLAKPKEIVPEISQKDINFSGEGNCEDASHDYKTETPETKTDQSDTAQNKNAVLPCCLDHGRITKIDNAPNQETNNLIFYAVQNESLSDLETPTQNSSYIQSLDLPPPKADILFSVFKKE
jgi:hypothetical protein